MRLAPTIFKARKPPNIARWPRTRASARKTTCWREQHDFARERVHKAGLADKIDIKLQDYRDETGCYDRIASIEMFEAVGEKYWPVFFRKMKDCLRPGGTAGLQIITINEKPTTPIAPGRISSSVTSFPAACCRRRRS